jgi:hypothetical protein
MAITFFYSPFAAATFHGRAYSFAAAEFNFAVPPRNDEDDIDFSGDIQFSSFLARAIARAWRCC